MNGPGIAAPRIGRMPGKDTLVADESESPIAGHDERPSSRIQNSEFTRLPRPPTCGSISDDSASRDDGNRGLRRQGTAFDGEVEQRIDTGDRAVVGHFLLRLPAVKQRQRIASRFICHGSLFGQKLPGLKIE